MGRVLLLLMLLLLQYVYTSSAAPHPDTLRPTSVCPMSYHVFLSSAFSCAFYWGHIDHIRLFCVFLLRFVS